MAAAPLDSHAARLTSTECRPLSNACCSFDVSPTVGSLHRPRPPRDTSRGLSKYVAILACASTLRQNSRGDRFDIGWRYPNSSPRSHTPSTPAESPILLSMSMNASSVPSSGSTRACFIAVQHSWKTTTSAFLLAPVSTALKSVAPVFPSACARYSSPSLCASICSHSHACVSCPPRLCAMMILRCVWCVGGYPTASMASKVSIAASGLPSCAAMESRISNAPGPCESG